MNPRGSGERGDEKMYIMTVSKHTAESCPVYNVALLKNIQGLPSKHGIKMVSSYADMPAHEIYNVYEVYNPMLSWGLP